MARYQITRSCGHAEEIQIYGPDTRGQRTSRAAREAQKLCADCYRLHRQRQAAEAAAVAAESGLPALTGSAAQVEWAERLRLAGLATLEDHAQRVTASIPDADVRARAAEALTRALIRIASTKTEAEWWLDHRHNIGGHAWRDATDADRRAVQAAMVTPQQLNHDPS